MTGYIKLSLPLSMVLFPSAIVSCLASLQYSGGLLCSQFGLPGSLGGLDRHESSPYTVKHSLLGLAPNPLHDITFRATARTLLNFIPCPGAGSPLSSSGRDHSTCEYSDIGVTVVVASVKMGHTDTVPTLL
ncbi:hypothetical protein BXZ70DRAFT_426587 [Cristinia sonorae]|uniref:Uncharacterized protein n=1 Tax=Cristinia sonorae TaxID=1940300 RepID=A0A8K0XU59_9AGAR|nr:hypothetical protein BXZ70DRAFT_426587 [Cristinia sonorae]